MADEQVRIRVWINVSTSERLDAYVATTKDARVADVVDEALNEFLRSRGI